jgi:REP element-mobilizing transposase RayT
MPDRKHIRISGYDYRTPGSYFVTICLRQRGSLFGSTTINGVVQSDAGNLIDTIWRTIPDRYPNIELDEYIVMPDHLHGIMTLESQDGELYPVSFISVIQWFKSYSTNTYINMVKTAGWPRFEQSFWQQDYYERVIRNERELEKFRNYIRDNPYRWILRMNGANR